MSRADAMFSAEYLYRAALVNENGYSWAEGPYSTQKAASGRLSRMLNDRARYGNGEKIVGAVQRTKVNWETIKTKESEDMTDE